MKSTVIWLFFFMCSPLFGQQLIQSGDTYTLTNISANAAAGHLSGNEFARQVGERLKKQFPSRVVEPHVQLSVFNKTGKVYFQHKWSCRIVKTTTNDADYYFDRRGTLLNGLTLKASQQSVQNEIRTSGKAQQLITSFERQFGNHRMPNSFVSSSWARLDGHYWFIEEYFIAARKDGR